MRLSRNTRRRLALYLSAVFIAGGALLVPRLIRRLTARVPIRAFDLEAAKGSEAARLLGDYVRIDTSNPPGITKKAAAYLADLFACEGIPYTITGKDTERPTLVARLAGRQREGALLLLNHMDVVPPGDLSQWSKPPFAGEMGDTKATWSYMIGRGTLDMKGQTIANLLAMAALKRAGIVPMRDIVFVGESGEEVYNPSLGTGWLLDHRPDLLAGVTDVFNEGGVNEVLGSDIIRFGIEVLQKAVVSISVDSDRREPLEEFKKFLEARDKELPIRINPTVRSYLRFIAPSRSDIWGRLMLGEEDAVATKRFIDLAPEVYRSLMKDMIYTGRIGPGPSGGFEMKVVETLLPGSSVARQSEELIRWTRERRLGLRLDMVTEDSVATPAEGRAWESVTQVLGLDPEKAPVGIHVLSGAYTTSSTVRSRGLRAYGVSPFNVGFHVATSIHHTNERIQLPSFVEGVERMRRIIFDFATAP